MCFCTLKLPIYKYCFYEVFSMLEQIKRLIRYVLFVYGWDYEFLVIFLFVASLICVVVNKLIKNKKSTNAILIVSFVGYFFFIIYKTLIDRSSTTDSVGFCLIPFYSYYQFFSGVSTEVLRQSIMNIAFFYPFGFLLSCLDMELIKKRKWLIVIFAMLFSLCVEILQYIFHLGYAEIDDVIHNTLGAGVGVVAFTLLNSLYKIIENNVSKSR